MEGGEMAGELTFRDEAAAEYDRAFAHVTAYFMPFLLRAAHLAPGMRVLDIATGTGLSAEAALAAVGALRQQIFNIAVAQGEAQVEPNRVPDHSRWEAVAGVGIVCIPKRSG